MNLIDSLNKPQYLLRPSQVLRRLAHAVLPAGEYADVSPPWGGTLRVNPRETVGRSIWHQGVHDLEVSEALWRLLSPGDCAVDAGANIGYMTHLMAHRVGASGTVLSFEAHPRIYEELRYNLARLARDADVGVVSSWQLALSAAPGEAKLLENEWFASNRGTAKISDAAKPARGNEIAVATVILDDYLRGHRVSVMKLDVEGHELQVLEGAAKSLAAQCIRNLVYEDFEAASKSPVHRLLSAQGYEIYALGQSLRGPVLSTLQQGRRRARAYDTPNYLASLEPQRVEQVFSEKGWAVLKRRSV